MRLSRLSVIAAAAAVMVGVGVSGVVSATGGSPVQQTPPLRFSADPPRTPGAQPVVARPPAGPVTVTLLTGDRVRLTTGADGGQQVTPLTPTGATAPIASFIRFTWAGDQYAVPDTALPYLSSTLDPELFDVSYLARAGLDDAHSTTLPVTVTQTAGSAAAGLPGAHVTRTAGTTATATLAKSRAPRLGALLTSTWRAARGGATTAPAGNLPGVRRIGLAAPAGTPAPAAPPRAAARPKATASDDPPAYHTLTVDTLDHAGAAGTSLVLVQNVDDSGLALFLTEVDGEAAFSVPDGTYSVVATILTPHPTGTEVDAALVARPEFTVAGDTTIGLDARQANAYRSSLDPAVHTPALRYDILGFDRTSRTGADGAVDGLTMDLLSLSPNSLPGLLPTTLYAAPSGPVHTGRFDFQAQSFYADHLSGEGLQIDPAYLLSFPHQGGIPATQDHQVSRAALTSVRNRLYGNAGGDDADAYLNFVTYEPWNATFEAQIGVPLGDRTDYWYSAEPDVERWQLAYDSPDHVRRYGGFRAVRPGGRIDETWGRSPLAPAPAAGTANSTANAYDDYNVPAVSPFVTVCPACRQDDNATLFVRAFGDADPTHYSASLSNLGTSGIRFYRNGKLALSSAAAPGGTLIPQSLTLPMLATPAGYELDWSTNRASDPLQTNDTDWTFRSGRSDAATRLPSTEQCAPDPTRSCAALPLLFLNYDLALDYRSAAPADAPFTVAFTVNHQGGAPAPRGTGATVSVSYDDGKTWGAPATATLDGHGRFAVTVHHPAVAATSGYVSLRVVAHDNAGNTVRQTIVRAYGLAAK